MCLWVEQRIAAACAIAVVVVIAFLSFLAVCCGFACVAVLTGTYLLTRLLIVVVVVEQANLI